MKRNAVIPYALIAVIGIALVVIMSVNGINQKEAIQNAEENGGQAQAEGGTTDPEAIFQNNCAACHGADLSGGAGPALQKVGSNYSKDEIKDIIINGKQGDMGTMPGGLVNNEQAEAIAKWLSEKK